MANTFLLISCKMGVPWLVLKRDGQSDSLLFVLWHLTSSVTSRPRHSQPRMLRRLFLTPETSQTSLSQCDTLATIFKMKLSLCPFRWLPSFLLFSMALFACCMSRNIVYVFISFTFYLCPLEGKCYESRSIGLFFFTIGSMATSLRRGATPQESLLINICLNKSGSADLTQNISH